MLSLLLGGTVQPGITYYCILKVTGQQKGYAATLGTGTTYVCLPKPASSDLTVKSDTVFTDPIGKDGVRDLPMS